MTPNESQTLLFISIGLVLGPILFFAGLRWLSHKRLIENIPTSKIRSIAMGLVEITGKVIPIGNNLMKSPFANEDCVYYKYTVEKWVKTKDSHYWRVVKSGKSETPFLINDNTGSVLVDSSGANVEVTKTTYTSGSGKDPSPIIKKFLESRNLDYEGFFGINYKMRFREALIRPNDTLYILGTATDNPFKEDGSAQHSSDDIMIHNGKGKIYYISDKSEKKVVTSYKIKSIAGLVVGALIIIVSINILLNMIRNF